MDIQQTVFEKQIGLDSPDEGLALLGACNGNAALFTNAFNVTCDSTADGLVIRGEDRESVETASRII